MPNQHEAQSFDFLATNSAPQKPNTLTYNFIKYVMTQITTKRLAMTLVLMSACYTVTSIPYYLYQSSSQNSAIEMTEQMNNIKKISPQEMTNILAFIDKNKNMEIARITELYWKIKFVSDSKPDKYNLVKYVRDMSKLNMQMVHHYNNRMNEISLAYKAVAAGNRNYEVTTYDNSNAYTKLLYWKNAMEINSMQSYTPLDEYIIQWDEDFTDQKAIQKYLTDNQELIANTKVFAVK